jgi:ABC-type polysaccharide/polyol phosphate export permease
MSEFYKDTKWALKNYNSWLYYSVLDIKTKYRRSVIGPFWISLSLIIFIGALSTIYSTLFKVDIETYIPYVTLGMVTWSLISAVILEGCSVFIDNQLLVLNKRVSGMVFVFRTLSRNIFVLGHHLVIALLILMLFGIPFSIYNLFIATVGLLIIIINSIWVIIVFGILSARYRDVQPFVASLLQILFMVTPVFWSVDALGGRDILANANVLFHFVEIFRAPLLGNTVQGISYVFVAIVTVAGFLLAYIMYDKKVKKIPYWL